MLVAAVHIHMQGGARSSAHYQEQLSLVDTLSALVLSGGGSASGADAVAAVQAAVPCEPFVSLFIKLRDPTCFALLWSLANMT